MISEEEATRLQASHADALKIAKDYANGACMGELLGEDCGWCPTCAMKRIVEILSK
jgi:hypothetical protein